jgi:hypothetical protein
MLTSIAGLGPRLKSARKAKKLSAKWMVNFLNGYMVSDGYPSISMSTYYAWERIGTHQEHKRGRRWPHIKEIKLMLIPLGITGYWLVNGDMDGKIVRDRSSLPDLQTINYGMEQWAAIQGVDKLRHEVNRLIYRLDERKRTALFNFVRLM